MNECRGIFITGTDTGVGKTYVTAGLARLLRGRGVDLGVMKPAETGCRRRKGKLVPSDALALAKAAGVRDRLSDINPYRFAKPLAPSLAAAHARKSVDPGVIQVAFNRLCRKHAFMLVEGAGGIMVPLAGRFTYLDLAADLGLPLMIVARPGLGTINHTLLTVSAARSRGITIAGVVFNYAEDQKKGEAERTNPGIIQELTGVKVLGVIGYNAELKQLAEKMHSLLRKQEGRSPKK